ncbi:MAG: 3-isopropylmalate dehydratase small subunit [Hyphomonadaceae bacterium]
MTLTTLCSRAIVLMRENIDTDQIAPKQFLTTLERTGLGAALFHDMRFDQSGAPRADFPLNDPAAAGASILITGANFGCGSSREHAAWALADYGIRCVVAESFGDIFAGNCFNNGVLPLRLDAAAVSACAREAGGAGEFTLDVAAQRFSAPSGAAWGFALDPRQKRKLLEGLDDIALTLARAAEIAAYEQTRLDSFD